MSDPAPAADSSGPNAPASAPNSAPVTAGRLEIFGWCMFDFANSSFTTVIATVVYSVYFTKLVCQGRSDADGLWGLATAISQGIVLVLAPLLGALADFSGAKKKFLTLTWLTCSVCTCLMYFVEPGHVWTGMILFIIANIAFSAGENFTASFLPELASPEDMGKVSGYGWALGYMGGLCALVLCYPLTKAGFELANAYNLRLTSLVTGIFFLVAGLPTFFFLKERGVAQLLPAGRGYVSVAWQRVSVTVANARKFRQLFRFLLVFATYNMGLCAIVAFAAIYAEKTLHFTAGDLTLFFLQLQLTAAVGAFALGFFQDRFGARAALDVSLTIWIIVSLGCWLTQTRNQFMVVGNLAGLALGSSQSGARALVGMLSPPSRSAEFFGFWALFWKASAALGPWVFGMVSTMSDQRTAVLVNGGFFVLGLIGLRWVNIEEGRQAALDAEVSYQA